MLRGLPEGILPPSWFDLKKNIWACQHKNTLFAAKNASAGVRGARHSASAEQFPDFVKTYTNFRLTFFPGV
jgi:hypothetical protein